MSLAQSSGLPTTIELSNPNQHGKETLNDGDGGNDDDDGYDEWKEEEKNKTRKCCCWQIECYHLKEIRDTKKME